MKKRWCTLLAAMLAAALLTGCAGSTQQTSGGSAAPSAPSQTVSSTASEQNSENSKAEPAADPENSQEGITVDPETGEVQIDPEVFGGDVSISEVSADDENPFVEVSYNVFSIDGSALGEETLPAHYILTSPQEVEAFMNSNKDKYGLGTAMVGNGDSKIPFAEYTNNYNDDFFAGQDLMMLFVCCSSAGDNDLGDMLADGNGNVNIEIWGEAPKSDQDKSYWCYAIAYRKGAMKDKKVSVKFASLAEGEE